MRSQLPTLHCDADDCHEWEVDDYEITTHSVNGIRITREQRALGWTNTDLDDFCPSHKPSASPTPPASGDSQ